MDAAPQTRPLIRTAGPWLIANAFVVALLLRDLAAFDGALIGGAVAWGRDFVNLWTGGTLVLSGDIFALYDLERYQAAQAALFGPISAHNYSYPPATLWLTVPFALMPYGVALAAWIAATGVLFVMAGGRWWEEATGLSRWLLLLLPASTVNIWAGHYGFLFAGLFLLGWRLIDDRPRLAGICFGLLIVKPHLAVLIPVVLLLRRDWATFAAAAATVGLLVLLSVAAFGAQPWRDYLGVTIGVQAGMIDATGMFFRLMATSTATSLIELTGSRAIAILGQAGTAAFGLLLIARAVRAGVPAREIGLLTATATFLVLPYGFNYDLVVPAMAAGMLLGRPLDKNAGRVALLGFGAAQIGMVLAAFGLPLMPVLLTMLVLVQYRAAVPANHRSAEPGQLRAA